MCFWRHSGLVVDCSLLVEPLRTGSQFDRRLCSESRHRLLFPNLGKVRLIWNTVERMRPDKVWFISERVVIKTHPTIFVFGLEFLNADGESLKES